METITIENATYTWCDQHNQWEKISDQEEERTRVLGWSRGTEESCEWT